ncbi:hypothetical protein [Planctomicrobium sp. SH527]|uniref:hypothetical protein n=1 Tax=Planctomicrobium sp. SH527 TaxID=3448123 RepID=UPI003F5B0CE9
MKIRLNIASLFIVTLIVLTQGCGSGSAKPMGTVTGTVSLNGEPLKEGRIIFRDTTGEEASGASKVEGGTYKLMVPPAEMKVEITAYREVPGKFMELNPGVKTPVIEQFVPAQYNAKSELTAKVVAGKNNFDFSLNEK